MTEKTGRRGFFRLVAGALALAKQMAVPSALLSPFERQVAGWDYKPGSWYEVQERIIFFINAHGLDKPLEDFDQIDGVLVPKMPANFIVLDLEIPPVSHGSLREKEGP